jgi:hypothetical protein
MKIRRGLGKVDAAEADRLVSEMNQLLADESLDDVERTERAIKGIVGKRLTYR